jgi:hypothetical protein
MNIEINRDGNPRQIEINKSNVGGGGTDMTLQRSSPPPPAKPQPPPAPPAAPLQPMGPPPPRPPLQQQDTQPREPNITKMSDAETMLRDLANPTRVKENVGLAQSTDSESEDEDGSLGFTENDDDSEKKSDYVVDEPADDEEPVYEERPTPPYKSLDEEKSALLWKLQRAKRAGLPVTRNLTIHSNIKELRSEVRRVEHEVGLDNGIKFMRRMLMLSTSGIELLNNRYDPFGLALDGWSNSVQEDIASYDKVFERLYEKYQDKADIAPELQLLLLVTSSAVTFHLTKKMMETMTMPQAGGGGNPLGSMFQMFMGNNKQAQQPQETQAHPSSAQKQPTPTTIQRKPMKGPSLQNMLPAAPPVMEPPKMSDRQPITMPLNVQSLAGTKHPREDDEETSDGRISDVVTSEEDGDDDDSSDAPSSDGSDEIKIQSMPVRGRGRGRGRGGRGGPVKNIVTL